MFTVHTLRVKVPTWCHLTGLGQAVEPVPTLHLLLQDLQAAHIGQVHLHLQVNQFRWSGDASVKVCYALWVAHTCELNNFRCSWKNAGVTLHNTLATAYSWDSGLQFRAVFGLIHLWVWMNTKYLFWHLQNS